MILKSLYGKFEVKTPPLHVFEKHLTQLPIWVDKGRVCVALQQFFRGSKLTTSPWICFWLVLCLVTSVSFRVTLFFSIYPLIYSQLTCAWLRPHCTVWLNFFVFSLSCSVRSCWPFAGVWSWQTMAMNDEWRLEVCLVPTECIIQQYRQQFLDLRSEHMLPLLYHISGGSAHSR